MKFRLFITISLFLFITEACAQKAKSHVLTADEAKVVKKDAATLFASEEYNGALKAYKDLQKADPKNTEYNYRLGYCYLQTNIDKAAALPFLETAVNSESAKPEWNFYLGLAYMHNTKWDEAIDAFTKFRDSKEKPLKDYPDAERMIQMCRNGKELMQHPLNVRFTNPGKNVNSPFEEYNPFISADGNQLVFTSRRKGNIGGFIEDLGIYTADIYWTQWKDTVWGKARGAGGIINGEWDEESVGMTPIGDQVYLYFDNAYYYADIGSASLKGRTWQRPVILPEKINTKQYEGAASISPDGNTIYFSSLRKEGSGGNDLWMVKREPGGEWGDAVNLGPNINTIYDEEAPFISHDGKRLFFSSKGWNSMGGFDIFVSEWDGSSWSKPMNIGYPINNADDNTFISFTGDMRFAWITAIRPEGLGERDIYQVEFLDTTHHPFLHVVRGKVTTVTGGRVELTSVTLENKSTKEKYVYRPATVTGEYVISADPGSYTLSVEGYNIAPYTQDIEIENVFPPVRIDNPVQVQGSK